MRLPPVRNHNQPTIMSKLALEEGVAAVLAQTRTHPPSLIPHLQRLEGLFIGATPIVALTATRRLRFVTRQLFVVRGPRRASFFPVFLCLRRWCGCHHRALPPTTTQISPCVWHTGGRPCAICAGAFFACWETNSERGTVWQFECSAVHCMAPDCVRMWSVFAGCAAVDLCGCGRGFFLTFSSFVVSGFPRARRR